MRIELLDPAGESIDLPPDHWLVPRTLHLVAQTPDEQRRMVTEGDHRLLDHGLLLRQLGSVGVVEAVPLVTEPEADGDREAQIVRPVDHAASIHGPRRHLGIPGANGVAAAGCQRFQRALTARAADHERLSVSQQSIAGLGITRYLDV